jgi:hypothetical protein
MRRVIIILSGLLFIAPAGSQNGDKSLKYFNKTEAGFAFGIGHFNTDKVDGVQKEIRNDQMVISLQNINGFLYQQQFGIGIGIGAEFWQKGLFFPVFAQISYALKPRDNTFFGSLNLGYNFGEREETSFYNKGTGALMVNVGLGYRMRVAKHILFNYEVFYKYQAIMSTYTSYISDDSTSQLTPVQVLDYKVPLHFLGFRIGITVP